MKHLFCVVGPSGAGKTTITNAICQLYNFGQIISITTRLPRNGETPGKDYHFINKKTYDSLEKVEAVEYAGNYYGIAKQEIEENFAKHDIVFVVVEIKGYQILKKYLSDVATVTSIFIQVDKNTLTSRLTRRGDSYENIQKRLDNIVKTNELDNIKICDYVINNNGQITHSIMQLENILKDNL